MTDLEQRLRVLQFGEIVTDSRTGFLITRTFGGFVYVMGQSATFVPFEESSVVKKTEAKRKRLIAK